MDRVMVIYGTRPEAIKLAPLIGQLTASEHLRPVPVVTGQHREVLDQVNQLFGVEPVHDLDIITPRQTLTDVTVRALSGLSDVIRGDPAYSGR
jgi:UDP-N-acetylglucosamine 2-epimerase (non-hydrolysing)